MWRSLLIFCRFCDWGIWFSFKLSKFSFAFFNWLSTLILFLSLYWEFSFCFSLPIWVFILNFCWFEFWEVTFSSSLFILFCLIFWLFWVLLISLVFILSIFPFLFIWLFVSIAENVLLLKFSNLFLFLYCSILYLSSYKFLSPLSALELLLLPSNSSFSFFSCFIKSALLLGSFNDLS